MRGLPHDHQLAGAMIALGFALAIAMFVLGRVLDSRGRPVAPPATPPSLYPRINTDACICSGACVSACPEGDVIGIVDGRPRLVSASACVGHGDCLRSCPVEAIELVLGTADRPVDVPITSGAFETTVPGLYVAGEVTGIGLIHNAFAQGRQAAARALDTAGAHDCELDLVVVGAGPAGLGAALEARRRGARCAVFEKGSLGGAVRSYPRAKIVMTAPIELPGLGKVKLRRTSKEALVALFEAIVERAGLAVVERAEVTGIHPIGDGLRVETTAGIATARRVVLAIGRRGTPRKLEVPGADLPHVVYEVPDPAHHAGRSIAVLGGGDSAVEVAVALAAQPATRVALIHRGPDLGRCKPANRRAIERSSVAVHLGATVRAVRADAVELRDAAAIPASLVVCCLGAELPGRWLRNMGVALRAMRGERI